MTTSTPPSTAPAAAVPGVDVPAFEAWLAATHPEVRGDRAVPLAIEVIEGGRSNLTYTVSGLVEPAILRRGPLGHALATAHDMEREARVISALAGSAVPVPRVLERSAVAVPGVDAPHFLMERVPGRVLRSAADNAGFSADQLRALSFELVDVLARIHSIDPAAVGLGDLGRPDGYLQRQLLRWRTQLDASRSRDLPELDRLGSLLATRMPRNATGALIHGDFRLDNVIVSGGAGPARTSDGAETTGIPDAPDAPQVAAVLDWEMATLGDPLADLALFGLYWDLGREAPGLARALPSSVSADAGYPDFSELVAHYAEVRRIPRPELGWYTAFSAFKLAIIAEGIHYRFQLGKTVGADFEKMGGAVRPIALIGLRHLGAETGEDS